MNLTLTQLNQPAASARSAAPAAASDAAAPAAATIDAAGAAPAPADGTQPAVAQPALGFAQWLGLDPLAAPIAEAPAAPVETAPLETDAPADEQAAADTPLLGAMAMAMPLMPVAQATLASVVAALPGVPSPKESAPAADTGTSQPTGSANQGRESKIELAALPAAMPVARASVEAAASAAAKPAAAALPAEALAVNANANADAAQEQSAPALDRTAANSFGVAAPAPGAAQRTGDTVTLSGPPTAWRQTLQEALGERLQLQVGKSAEQAVIRLEPPMLGRVEIAIRHSAGSLEVHISATHGEVLRQLQTVSEGLRNDLAQRQFSDVSVNIAPAPRGAAGANNTPMFAGGDGRGRQQDGRQQEQGPGEALAEANTGSSPFSLNGRGHGFT